MLIEKILLPADSFLDGFTVARAHEFAKVAQRHAGNKQGTDDDECFHSCFV